MTRRGVSFRVRLLAGTLLWTLGLLYVVHLVSALILVGPQVFPSGPRLVALLVVALAAIAAGVVIVRRGMVLFRELRQRLADVHAGRERQVTGPFPSEVQPLVDDLNALLAHHDRRVRDALSRAGDLAHGLKTPLAVLAHEAERAGADGHHEIAATLSEQVERMRRQIDYHLAHARAAASGAVPGAGCRVADSARALARTLERLHAGRGVAIAVDVPADHAVRSQREDLDEMLGNLLDNACTWARARVAVTTANGQGHIAIAVDDDGPGLSAALRDAVLQRGVRTGETAGSGFGLAITRELADLYGGRLVLDASPLGGLRAVLHLPPAPLAHSAPVQARSSII